MGNWNTGAVGRRAESLALEHLRGHGLTPVARNFRSRGGEIDLIMLDGDCLAFIEVRSRRSSQFASPASTVDARKRRKLTGAAAMFIVRHDRYADFTMRFDVVSIEGTTRPRIHWITDAFRPDDSAL